MTTQEQLKKEFDEWLGNFPTQGVNEIADWWLAKLSQATRGAVPPTADRTGDKGLIK